MAWLEVENPRSSRARDVKARAPAVPNTQVPKTGAIRIHANQPEFEKLSPILVQLRKTGEAANRPRHLFARKLNRPRFSRVVTHAHSKRLVVTSSLVPFQQLLLVRVVRAVPCDVETGGVALTRHPLEPRSGGMMTDCDTS